MNVLPPCPGSPDDDAEDALKPSMLGPDEPDDEGRNDDDTDDPGDSHSDPDDHGG